MAFVFVLTKGVVQYPITHRSFHRVTGSKRGCHDKQNRNGKVPVLAFVTVHDADPWRATCRTQAAGTTPAATGYDRNPPTNLIQIMPDCGICAVMLERNRGIACAGLHKAKPPTQRHAAPTARRQADRRWSMPVAAQHKTRRPFGGGSQQHSSWSDPG
ncbi:hypothetical protein [Rhodobacter ferrooxidans]|uniref:hypothetical protein n=1 Tax=Rhodobacter ferrooxidans TaxID=371731 RepID=UPI0012EAACDA|nr:hypothetical protein [Rhodobacter sp. SW2]